MAGGPNPKQRPQDYAQGQGRSEEARYFIRAVGAIGNLAERCGVAFAVLLIILFAIWTMGSDATQDDFVREVLFGSITDTRYVSVFFVVLVMVIVIGGSTKVRSRRIENAEMKRLADEKAMWQERALGTTLSHTPEERT